MSKKNQPKLVNLLDFKLVYCVVCKRDFETPPKDLCKSCIENEILRTIISDDEIVLEH